jgi:hypothetical protein
MADKSADTQEQLERLMGERLAGVDDVVRAYGVVEETYVPAVAAIAPQITTYVAINTSRPT